MTPAYKDMITYDLAIYSASSLIAQRDARALPTLESQCNIHAKISVVICIINYQR